ncbi:MAG: SLC13 family permease [Chitinophagaceae bacterium]
MSVFMSDPIFILFVGVLIVVGGIIGLKMHPFLALLLAAFVVAWMTPGSAIEQFALDKGSTTAAALQASKKTIGERVALEFGNTAGKLGILIAMAAIIGKCLLESGAAERIIRSILYATGEKKAPVAFLTGSFFIGIPVFFDTVIFLMMPLAKVMSIRIGKNYLLLVLSILAGAVMANSLVPPAPGPLFLVSAMQIDIGQMMVAGSVLGIMTASSGYLFALWANRKWTIPVRDSLDARLEDIKENASKQDAQLPSLWFSLLPVLIPLVFICADTFLNQPSSVNPSPSFIMDKLKKFVHFFGDKNIALVTGGLVALILLATRKREKKLDMSNFVQAALMSAGGIILITSAGGAFGGMLQQTGISAEIAQMTKNYQMALIPLAFIISAVVRTAQGSATVALITASGILAGMANSGHLQYNHLYIGLAIGCGAKLVPWMNDAGFWIVCKMSNLTEREAMKTFAPMNVIMGVTGLIIILIAAALFPNLFG